MRWEILAIAAQEGRLWYIEPTFSERGTLQIDIQKMIPKLRSLIISSVPLFFSLVQPEDFKLPEDFVREHRDYFSKLDEEELIVEEANSE